MNLAIHRRISEDDEQRGKGVARQAKDCRSLVTRLAWTGDVTMSEENDTSATRSKRPVFERLMTDTRPGDIDAIAFWNSDRITRSPREAEDVIDLMEARGMKVVGFHGDDLTSADGQMMFGVKITVAKNEIDKMRRRIRATIDHRPSTIDQRAAEGRIAGQTGFGFSRHEEAPSSPFPARLQSSEELSVASWMGSLCAVSAPTSTTKASQVRGAASSRVARGTVRR